MCKILEKTPMINDDRITKNNIMPNNGVKYLFAKNRPKTTINNKKIIILETDIILRAFSGFEVKISSLKIYLLSKNVCIRTIKKGIELVITIIPTGLAKYAISG